MNSIGVWRTNCKMSLEREGDNHENRGTDAHVGTDIEILVKTSKNPWNKYTCLSIFGVSVLKYSFWCLFLSVLDGDPWFTYWFSQGPTPRSPRSRPGRSCRRSRERWGAGWRPKSFWACAKSRLPSRFQWTLVIWSQTRRYPGSRTSRRAKSEINIIN